MSKLVSKSGETNVNDYTLYGADVSYFTGKARAYLRWRGVAFSEAMATQAVYRDVILPNVGWPVIPVLQTPSGEVVQDSADIISRVEDETGLEPSVYPVGAVQNFVSELLHLYADEWLVLPAMHYRWNYNEDWTYGEFGRMSAPQASPEEQYQIGAKNGQRFKGALPPLGVTASTLKGIETAYEAFLDDFSAHLKDHDFLLGDRPCLADFAMIGPLYAHLWRDPTSRELMESRAPRVAAYVHRVHNGEKGKGELLAGDQIPETLFPVLARQMREQIPALKQTIAQFTDWLRTAEPQAALPRGFGEIRVLIEGCEGPAAARSFPLFRLQGVLDAFAKLEGSRRAQAEALLTSISGQRLAELRLPARLVRRNCRLCLA